MTGEIYKTHKEDYYRLETRYNFGDFPKAILNFIKEFLTEVEGTKEFIRRFFSN